MPPIYHIKEKEDKRKKRIQTKKDIIIPKKKIWVVERENKLDGIVDSESCLQDMKRKLRTISVWCNYHAELLFIES